MNLYLSLKLGQVFTKNGLKGVKYEKNKSISILYPIDYQYVTTNRMLL